MKPLVLFVCVKNAGKSQIAGAFMRQCAGDQLEVATCGTLPGQEINQVAREVVSDMGASMEGEYPKGVNPDLVAHADRVVVLGTEADLTAFLGAKQIVVWELDEPSQRGIEGVERMKMLCGEIKSKVEDLYAELIGTR